jgi:hypothetical protein
MVWSASPVKVLEAVIDAVNDQELGEIKDPMKVRAVRDFLKSNSSPKPELSKDSAKKQTTVRGKGVLVSLIDLEHH